ncbi:MAG TPA: BatD family protein, partial [Thermoanaerobaculia bacterium]|nr:BatD family protein [Thermoanaerobaculia bacterium]
ALPVQASNNLSIDRRTIRLGETLTITVSLEDEFAELDHVPLPLRNLTITDPPSMASEFSWINGSIVRRKVLRYRARATAAGPALIGPLVLRAGGQTDTLPAIAVEVISDRAAASNDPAVILPELLATGREPLFVVADVTRERAWVGEQVIVTWYLYNGSTVQQWQIGSIPKLDDFWVEELDVRSTRASSAIVAGEVVQRVPVRRVAVYPLRAGRLEIGPMEVEAAVLRRSNRGPFAFFEGQLVEIAFASAPVTFDTRPIPAGPAVAAVGDLTLRCSPPKQERAGPVVIDAELTGRGNLRAASPPLFASAPAGEVQRLERGVTLSQGSDSATMTRRWQFLVFPRHGGDLTMPPLQMRVFSTAAGERQLLSCAATTLAVSAAERPRLAASAPPRGPQPLRPAALPVMTALAIGGVFLFAVVPWWRRRTRLDRQIRRIMAGGNPSGVRENVHTALTEHGIDPVSLLREGSDRGDAYRSLRSLLDALERDRIDVDDRNREIRRRLRELLLA